MNINYCHITIFFICEIFNDSGFADPCKNYTLINDTTRLTTYITPANETAFCDNFDPNWYRFDASLAGSIPTECPHGDSVCGADMQIYMNDTLPTLEDDIVQKEFCVRDYSECCGMKKPLDVKNCTTYFVYNLEPSPDTQCFRYCIQDSDECLSSPCRNGATCYDGLKEYTCNCTGGWTGHKCENVIEECASSPCLNGATCIDKVNGYICTCTMGWNGTNCETDTGANISISLCGNFTDDQSCEGGSLCDEENGKLICKSIKTDDKSVSSNTDVVTAVSVCGALAFIAIILIIICFVMKRRRKQSLKQLTKPDTQDVQRDVMAASVEYGSDFTEGIVQPEKISGSEEYGSDFTGQICLSHLSPDS